MSVREGNTRISTLAALRGENPPGTRKKRRHKIRRNKIAKASRKRNRK